jgi:hypothetical protein
MPSFANTLLICPHCGKPLREHGLERLPSEPAIPRNDSISVPTDFYYSLEAQREELRAREIDALCRP